MSILNTQSGDDGPVFYNSGSFYGIKLFNEVKDDLDFNRNVACIPNVNILNSNSNILLDYTQCISSSNSQYITDIIKGVSLGAGFTLENAKYIDPDTGVASDISGTFTYSATFDKVIYGNVSSITNPENIDKKYNSIGFFDEFNAIFSVNNTDTTEKNTIKNLFGTSVVPSFNSIGVQVNDYVKIMNGNNQSSTLHKIDVIYEDFNDHEIIKFGNTADFIDENRSGSATELRFYRIPSSVAATVGENVINAVGNAISVSEDTITNLVGRVNVITPYIANNCFYNAGIKKPTYVCTIGASYVFNLTHTSLLSDNFVFRISTIQDGKWGGGIPSPNVFNTDNLLVFEPTASGTFYYYCENHPNAGGLIIVKSGSISNDIVFNATFTTTEPQLGYTGIYG
tara:strand:+ start:7250 stop:8440 length:1191 start_codon:yes stop_codon:yes gene_type:complete